MMELLWILLAGLLGGIGWLVLIGAGISSVGYLSERAYRVTIETPDMSLFIIIADIGLLLGYGLLLSHFVRSADFMYQAHPYEMQFLLERATINLLVQMAQIGILLATLDRSRLDLRLPPMWLLFAGAAVGTLGSIGYNAVYRTSLCCENPLATYWGFPFSWLYGIAQDPPFAPYDQWTTYAYIVHFRDQMQWRISLWKLGADFLFWWNVIFVGCAWPFGLRLIKAVFHHLPLFFQYHRSHRNL